MLQSRLLSLCKEIVELARGKRNRRSSERSRYQGVTSGNCSTYESFVDGRDPVPASLFPLRSSDCFTGKRNQSVADYSTPKPLTEVELLERHLCSQYPVTPDECFRPEHDDDLGAEHMPYLDPRMVDEVPHISSFAERLRSKCWPMPVPPYDPDKTLTETLAGTQRRKGSNLFDVSIGEDKHAPEPPATSGLTHYISTYGSRLEAKPITTDEFREIMEKRIVFGINELGDAPTSCPTYEIVTDQGAKFYVPHSQLLKLLDMTAELNRFAYDLLHGDPAAGSLTPPRDEQDDEPNETMPATR